MAGDDLEDIVKRVLAEYGKTKGQTPYVFDDGEVKKLLTVVENWPEIEELMSLKRRIEGFAWVTRRAIWALVGLALIVTNWETVAGAFKQWLGR